jgi:hypothetical protein
MRQTFGGAVRSKSIAKCVLAMAASVSVVLLGQDGKTPPSAPPAQPIPYSHKQHIAIGLKCQSCHVEPDPGEMMTYPVTSMCMKCHASIDADKPAIKKLADYAKANEEIPWVRVYRIPEWVDFSHKKHLDAGATCENCHGQVSQRDVLTKEVSTSMATCMECHRQRSVSTQCDYCHDPR